MQVKRSILAAVMFGTLSLLTTTAAWGADYKIVVDRARKVGDKFEIDKKISIKVTRKATQNGNAAPPQEEQVKAELGGVVTVVAVTDADKGSQMTKYTCKVTKCTNDGQPMVADGTVITAENVDGKTVVTIDGKAPDEEFKAPMDELFDTADPKDESGDEIAGTPEPQKIGATWEAKGDFFAKKLSEEKLPFGEGDIKGKTKLAAVDTTDDTETLEITFKGGFAKKDVPGGTMTDAKFDLKATTVAPIDTTKPAVGETLKLTLSFTVNTDEGTMKVSTEREQTTTMKPVK